MEVKQMNHEVWTVCETCGQEYDARLNHICESKQEEE